MNKTKKWLIVSATLAGVAILLLFVAASIASKRFEPYIREQAIQYLRTRFDSDVELASLRVRLPRISALRLLLTHGRGAIASVEGEGISLRQKGRQGIPPIFAMKTFSFHVDLHGIFETPKIIPLIILDGIEITVPPRGTRTDTGQEAQKGKDHPDVIIEEVLIRNARLTILPKKEDKVPLEFDIHEARLQSAGKEVAMKYHAILTNAKPPGQIQSTGTFGPWNAEEPGDTPLSGNYEFSNADLSVFHGIAGILHSTGSFEGSLAAVHARGEASVPDFRLKMSGNRVSLFTRFDALVDGTNGNTILKPVIARLGSTDFTTGGGVVKHERDLRRTIQLDVLMPKGDLNDLLRLAMKGEPFMDGRIFLKTTIDIPPLTGKVREKLLLDGRFEVSEGKFLRSTVQDQIDSLSRRGQGQPKNEQIDEVVSRMKGRFRLADEEINFESLSFGVPGADVAIAGLYALDRDALDFRGTLRLKAKVSQTMTGCKRWALKPVDPFFAKDGAGVQLHIKIDGSAKEPKFGLDRGHKESEEKTPAKTAG